MVKTATATTPNRDQRRETIMSVAREVFFEHGYTGTSMSAIAARLGGSKGTLYNYFKSKEELFEAQLRDLCDSKADELREAIAGDEPPDEALSNLGRSYLAHLYSEETVKLFRILVAESQRSPELGRLFYAVGPARGRKSLEEYFLAAKAKGLLDIPDCGLAANQFLSLCKGAQHLQFLLNLIPPLTAEEIGVEVDQAVHAFMAIYGRKSSNG
jgi:AcrR family transcriptional regulator